jgi:hypothetical protein
MAMTQRDDGLLRLAYVDGMLQDLTIQSAIPSIYGSLACSMRHITRAQERNGHTPCGNITVRIFQRQQQRCDVDAAIG